MKKIISMGIASAVLALTAIAASAAIKADTKDALTPGSTITVDITTTEAIDGYQFVVSAEGLEVVKVKQNKVQVDGEEEELCVTTKEAKEDGSYLLIGGSAEGWKAGDVIATITYTVTAEEGEKVAVAFAPDGGVEATFEAYGPFTVGEAGDPGQPGQPVDPADPGNPGTGVALAVVPAVLAGAAVVVAKKRK